MITETIIILKKLNFYKYFYKFTKIKLSVMIINIVLNMKDFAYFKIYGFNY